MTDFSHFLIVTDLDGTFLDRKGETVPRNLDAVAHFCAHGGRFTVNTGRPHNTVLPTIPQIAALQNAPSVHCNGAYLHDFRTGEFFFEQTLPEKDAADLLAFALEFCADIPFRVMTRTQTRVFVPAGSDRPQIPGCDQQITVFDLPVDRWPMGDWYKLVFIAEPARILQARRDFVAVFGTRFAMTTSSARSFEVQLATCSKAAGLTKLRRYSPDTAARTLIACGDFENDIPMLQAADVAVCPANAMDEVKAICDLVLCDCDEGLIGDVVDAIAKGKIQPQ